MNIMELSALELREALLNKELKAEEIIKEYLSLIKETEDLNTFISIDEDGAIEAAKRIDEKNEKGESLGRLAGIPIGIKDNIVTKDFKTTGASKMLENFISPFDATVVERIKEEDGIIIGKTNLDEFACGSSGETSYFGPVLNPIDRRKTTGGSSSGSAAALSAKQVLLTLGSDTGGSIRQPASYCGVVGMRPTYGLVSKWGLISLSNSLDQIGPMAQNVQDLALLLDIISGEDLKDTTTLNSQAIDSKLVELRDVKIGLPKICFEKEVQQPIKEAILDNLNLLKENNITIDFIDMDSFQYGESAYYMISRIEASSNMSRYDGVNFGYRTENYETMDDMYKNSRMEALGYEVRKRIISGTYMLRRENRDRYYVGATKLRTLIIDEFTRIFEDYDFIITPTTPNIAFDKDSSQGSTHKSDVYTLPSSLAGLPSLTIPGGLVDEMPIGIQILGDRFKDKDVLNLAYTLENKINFGGEQ